MPFIFFHVFRTKTFPDIWLPAGRVQVVDGDTIKIQGMRSSIRLMGIDAPELGQKSFDARPIGKWSKRFLLELIGENKVFLELHGRGFYGRYLAYLYLNKDQESLNLRMVKSGHALVYARASFPDRTIRWKFLMAQNWARSNKKGMWKTKGFYSPKDYRRNKFLKVSP